MQSGKDCFKQAWEVWVCVCGQTRTNTLQTFPVGRGGRESLEGGGGEMRKPEPRGVPPGPCTRWWAGHEAVVFGKDESVSRLVHTTRRYQPRPRSQVEGEGEQAEGNGRSWAGLSRELKE